MGGGWLGVLQCQEAGGAGGGAGWGLRWWCRRGPLHGRRGLPPSCRLGLQASALLPARSLMEIAGTRGQV